MPMGLAWMVFVPGPLSLVWLFCCVDWERIAPQKKEGGQTEDGSVIAEGSAREKDQENSKNLTEVLSVGENDEEENKLLIE
jgi:hypothetical protein